ncbi:Fc receptor-like protein 5 isoform X2 [Nelusetta ayraudi]|uniref:Fc receptor-like protein 5 isoform X2 n=1 Tax=Nelusetta ayraudi TaxID=303726 RepID=UPI003F713CD7
MSRMAMTTFCALVMCLSPLGALRVHPSKTQFFLYESLFLSCGGEENSYEWKCRRNTTSNTNQACCRNAASCSISDLYQADSGVYWCESAAGKHNDSINITVTRLPVILESPAAPVTEGDSVTLRCRSQDTSTSSSGVTTDFYKDGMLLWRSSSTNLTLHRVSKANEGLYKCNISDKGGSPESWLIVRGAALLVLMLLFFLRRQQGPGDPDLPYIDVIFTQEVEPANRTRDTNTERTLYSAVKPGSSS